MSNSTVLKSKSGSYHVAESPIHGKGVFASRQINEGEILGVLNTTPAKRNGSHVLWITEDRKVRVHCNLRYVNHSESPNAVYYDTLEVVALRNIKKDEEITHDYSGE
jgi:SET domain-containing protein